MTTRERRPSHGAPSTGIASRQAAAKQADDAHATPDRRPFAQTWPRVLARRRASRELDRLLGCDAYPDVHVVYGLVAA